MNDWRKRKPDSHTPLERRLNEMADAVEADEAHIGVLSTSERIAVAMILDRRDLLAKGDTMLDSVDRLGVEWLAACLYVHKQRR